MSSGQNLFESDADYKARIAREAKEQVIENATGSAPSQGIFEKDSAYRDRITNESNERSIEMMGGGAPSQGFLEKNDAYQARIAQEVNERTIESSTGKAANQGLFEKDEAYRERVALEANERIIEAATGSAPTKGVFEKADVYRERIAKKADEARADNKGKPSVISGLAESAGSGSSSDLAMILKLTFAILAFSVVISFWIFKKMWPFFVDLWKWGRQPKDDRKIGLLDLWKAHKFAATNFVLTTLFVMMAGIFALYNHVDTEISRRMRTKAAVATATVQVPQAPPKEVALSPAPALSSEVQQDQAKPDGQQEKGVEDASEAQLQQAKQRREPGLISARKSPMGSPNGVGNANEHPYATPAVPPGIEAKVAAAAEARKPRLIIDETFVLKGGEAEKVFEFDLDSRKRINSNIEVLQAQAAVHNNSSVKVTLLDEDGYAAWKNLKYKISVFGISGKNTRNVAGPCVPLILRDVQGKDVPCRCDLDPGKYFIVFYSAFGDEFERTEITATFQLITDAAEPKRDAVKVAAAAARAEAAANAFHGPYLTLAWDKATAYCSRNGGRLPTAKELKKMRKAECNREHNSDICDQSFLSSEEEDDTMARMMDFRDGRISYVNKRIPLINVRCVE